MKVDLPYLMPDKDRRGNDRLFVRRYGRKIRIRAEPGTREFHDAYTAALADLDKHAPIAKAPASTLPTVKPNTFGWLVTKWINERKPSKVASKVVQGCLTEPLSPADPRPMRDVPLAALNSAHVRMLRDRKKNAGLNGAANNRKKYISSMFGWAIEQDPPIMLSNPARDAKRVEYETDGFHTWTVAEVEKFRAYHPVGTRARLAMEMLLFIGMRRGDFVRLGKQHRATETMLDDAGDPIQVDGLRFKAGKTRRRKNSVATFKPVLPALAEIITASPCGDLTYLVTEYGRPFTAAGFGNWFGDRCVEADVPGRAHGLRKAGATLAAAMGATTRMLMAMYDWSTVSQAEVYTRAADQQRLAAKGAPLLAKGMGRREQV